MPPVNRFQGFFDRSPEKPPKHILDWCENLVRILADGAVWGIPRSQTIFRVDKPAKKLILIEAGDDDGNDFEATKNVFAHIGWAVVKRADGDETKDA